jgi:hypothetical protein
MGSRFLSCAGVCFAITVSLIGGAAARQIAVNPDPNDCPSVLAACKHACYVGSGATYSQCMTSCYQDDLACHKRTGSGSPGITPVPRTLPPKAVQPPH